eukprot:5260119-Amphidinium_carterae.1
MSHNLKTQILTRVEVECSQPVRIAQQCCGSSGFPFILLEVLAAYAPAQKPSRPMSARTTNRTATVSRQRALLSANSDEHVGFHGPTRKRRFVDKCYETQYLHRETVCFNNRRACLWVIAGQRAERRSARGTAPVQDRAKAFGVWQVWRRVIDYRVDTATLNVTPSSDSPHGVNQNLRTNTSCVQESCQPCMPHS